MIARLALLLCVVLVLAPSRVAAINLVADDLRCAKQAADRMGVSAAALLALRVAEGGQLGTVSWNENGSADVGPLQINSSWFKRFKAQGITPDLLTNNRCVSYAAAAWILSYELQRAGGDWVVAIGRYHSPTDWRASAYAQRVAAITLQMTGAER